MDLLALAVPFISQWAEISRAHKEAFGDVMPATSMVEVSRLIDPKMLVEIEAVVILSPMASSSGQHSIDGVQVYARSSPVRSGRRDCQRPLRRLNVVRS